MAAMSEWLVTFATKMCTPTEKRDMAALATFGPGPVRSGDVADFLKQKTSALGPVRDKLIKKGMIYAPQHGDTQFTAPMFDEFMRRTMPEALRP